MQTLNNDGGGDNTNGYNSYSILDIFCGSDVLHTLFIIVTMTLIFEYDCLHSRSEEIEAQRD